MFTSRIAFPAQSSDASVGKSNRPRSGKVPCFAIDQVITGFVENRLDLAVKVASAGESFPHGRDPMLPLSHTGFGGAAVLNKNKSAVWLHYPSDFIKREPRISNRAQGPGEHDRIDASTGKWDWALGWLGMNST